MPAERRAAGERRGAPRRKSDKKVTTGSKLDLILDVTRRLMSITDLDALLRDMAQATTQLLDADRATIFIVDREKNEIWSRVALGTGVGEIRQPVGVGIAGTVAATGETVNIPDAYADPRFNPEPDKRSGYRTRSLLTFPMTGQNGRVIGVFQAVNKKGRESFNPDDEETLSSLGAPAAVAVENAQLLAEQKRLWDTLIETLAVTIDARYYKPAYSLEKTLEIMDTMAGVHLDPAVVAAVRRSMKDLEWTLESLKHTWPKPGDEGMGSLQDAELSERDRAAKAAGT